jgi:malonyl CoA-acyl carrier protein transacylase/NAD(P)-dependent dehydrogenase (short-subunit alcohol dehydrogenase family)
LCALGSVKTNIGHCDSAAGIAGLIKAVLCLEHGTLVPSLHFEKPNPQLDLDRSRFYINTETTAWKQTPRLAGVSSFGIGGTNAHVILGEAPPSETPAQSRPWQVLTLSARNEAALERRRADLASSLRERPNLSLADIAFTLNAGRRDFAFRQSFVCANAEDAIAALTSSKEEPVRAVAQERPVIFLFPGQGKAYTDLGSDLYRDETRFRAEVDYCCSRLVPLIGADLRDLMFAQGGMDASIYRPLFWQTALFTVEYAMAQLWISWGIKPAAMIGHSLGEYVAATLAGVLELDHALLLVAERARRTEDLEPGAMLAVPAREDEIHPYIKDGISLAAVNGPELCILAGSTGEIQRVYEQIAFLNPIRLDASHAFHSRLVEPLMDPLTRTASRMKLCPPRIPYLSNVTGSWMSDQDATNPDYWARHVRSTVRFNDSLRVALEKPNSVLLEVGPGKVLSELARRTYPETITFASMPSELCGRALAQTVGRLWCEGIAVDWLKYYETEDRCRVPLPTYPFERQRYWVSAQPGSGITAPGDPLAFKDSPEKWLYATNWKRTNPLPRLELSNNSFAGSWLVFSETDGIGAELASMLRRSGQTVHEARRGKAFQQNGAGSVTLDAGNPEDYQRLLQSLEEDFPQRIIHAWDFSRDGETSPAAGFDRLIYLAQAVASSEKVVSVRMALITSGLHRVLDEELGSDSEAAQLGIVHVLPKEAPAIKCQNIDLDEKHMDSGRLAEHVVAEFASDTPDTIVAYCRGHRWLPIAEQTSMRSGGGYQFKRGGIYVITHALQEIGFALAEHLVREFECKVVMLARSFFPRPEEWEQWVREQGDNDPISRSIVRLRDIGESLTILSADVSDSERLKRVKGQIEREQGDVQGVLHLDRAAKTGLILGKSMPPLGSLRNDLAELAALEQAFGNELLVIFSSNLAESGGIGQVDQAARNAVIGHFAERRAATGRPTVALELGTRAWTEAAEENPDSGSFLSQQLEEKRQRFGMTAQECVAALQHALSLSVPNVIVSTRDFNALMEQQHLFTTDFFQQQIGNSAASNGNGASHGRPDVSTSYTAPRNEVETLLVELWQGTFRIQEIGVADNFFELGGHSLLAVQLLKNMNQTFSSKITLKDLFDGPTIEQLAAKISGTPTDNDDAAELEALLAEIEGMSADDLRAELDGSKEGINTE